MNNKMECNYLDKTDYCILDIVMKLFKLNKWKHIARWLDKIN